MEQQFLLPGDSVTTRKPMHLATLLGSCVSVCLSNPFKHTAGMNHYMLPVAPDPSEAGRYGDTSIRRMVATLFALDPDPKHYRARIYGGGNVLGHLGALGDIGERNIEIARKFLGDLRIAVHDQQVGGTKGRRVNFNTETDMIDCRVVGVNAGPPERMSDRTTRVLIVDDSPVARRVLRAGLEGCEGISIVGEAGNPFEARDQILSTDPDVLTLDIEMPRMDGVTFLTHLMKYLPKPVIVMSALATPGSDVERRARAAGAFEVFDKGRLELQDSPQIIRQVLAPALRRAASHKRGFG
jgi:two-component system chemotaxis response regulator CheB